MASIDALWLRIEKPTSSMANQTVLWFEEPLDWARLREVIHQRLVERFPRFRQRAVQAGGGFRWEDAADFKLEDHLKRTVLPAPSGRAELEALASQAFSTRLERARPLWQMQLVEGYGQGCALLVRAHHCLADGMTLMKAFLSIMDEHPPGQPPLPAHDRDQEKVLRAHLERKRRGDSLRWVATVGRILMMRPDPPSPIRGPLGVEKQVVWSDPLPLTVWQRMVRGTGATMNDVLIAVVAGAVGRYLREHGAGVDELRANVAVQLRRPSGPLPQALGNVLGSWLVALPVREQDPILRLREIYRRLNALKHSSAAVVYRDLMSLGGRTSVIARVGTRILGSKCSLAVSNLKGPRKPIFLTGVRMTGAALWMPPILGLGLQVTFFSHAGTATLGVSADVGLIPYPREFLLALHQEMRELAGVESYGPSLEWRP